MTDSYADLVSHSEPFRRLRTLVTQNNSDQSPVISGLSGSLIAVAAGQIADEGIEQILVVCTDRDKAEMLRDDLTVFGTAPSALFVHAHHHASTVLDLTGPVNNTEALRTLTENHPVVVAASLEAAISQIPPPEVLRRHLLTIEKGKQYPFQNLLSQLADLGFERKDFVEEYGDVAVRGGIVDVYSFLGEHPLRIEFWGDSVESIREFDVRSQRSVKNLSSATIAARMFDRSDLPETGGFIFDYLDRKALILLDEPAGLQHEAEKLHEEGVEHIMSWQQFAERVKAFRNITHSNLMPDPDIAFGGLPQPPLNGSIRFLVEELRRKHADGYEVFLMSDSPEEENRLKELVEDEVERLQIEMSPLRFSTEAVHEGFVFPPAHIAVYTEHQIFGRLKRRGSSKKTRFKGLSQRELFRLKRGDYVVHTDYGIGRFAGLHTIRVKNIEQEVMKVQYEENDVLYVNLNFVNRVQKYSSRDGHEPALTRLGTPQWDRLKSRAHKRVKDIARDLIALYARRKNEAGFAFSPDSHWQKELEASFMYEDTPDQARATGDVKNDMMQSAPMDRLICGDVGFGKTEVAVRAAFKAVLDGKQVAVLVPTTILAQQHHLTFMDRLQRYTVRVESLTRFKSKKEQKNILVSLAEGSADILIGTHRLLSKDVVFKNLGLLVIDEEHRFGVRAKEKLRSLRATVDTLTLTATPIPRTLQFSLMGARDLSIINTPPRNRLPIATEIAEFDLKLMREAILRELHRGGQVYVIHDRIQSMEDIVHLLRKHVPEARIHVAHGQMKGHELETTMVEFLERKYDVLICTKIIESGIDIPSVNTIIINRADRFGLAELYQLRGRVGRSNVQAYAYLLTPPLSSLPRETLQRLQAIQEFTELGSGFNLAMRDMEIRGAGNLLGAEQSGFILEMGYEMYQKIVEEAVRELKTEEFKELADAGMPVTGPLQDTVIETDIEALIPEMYVAADSERLDIYRRLYQMKGSDEVDEMRKEMQDRFGEYPPEVEDLFRTVEVKIAAAAVRITKVEISKSIVTLWFPPEGDTEFYDDRTGSPSMFQAVMDTVTGMKELRSNFRQDGKQLKLVLRIPDSLEQGRRLAWITGILGRIAG